MNEDEIRNLWNQEGTYSSSLCYEIGVQKATIITRFICELHSIDGLYDEENGENIVVRIYELINILNEIGFSREIIMELTDIANMISYE